ncbi:hypothetical protein [Nitrobacter sp. JJSN]|uniref:hypothetical protein n=1 Tax=Nitrobacter sp. JJSN TaxID=3453033 RepID=UPI003F762C0A
MLDLLSVFASHPSCNPSISRWSNGENVRVKKLHDLKQWLTVADAARYLSILFGEDVTDADVFRLGLDGQLRLSVYFVNGARGRCGPVVSGSDAKSTIEWTTPKQDPEGTHGLDEDAVRALTEANLISEADLADGITVVNFAAWVHGLLLGDGKVLEYAEKTVLLDGVWDLTMLGHERLEVEQIYQSLTGGPEVDMSFQDGQLDHPIVSREDGTYCQIHERNASAHYRPAACLPVDSVIVVRTSALRDLEARLSEPDQRADKPIARRERATLLVMIAALAQLAKIDVSKPSGAATAIEHQSALMGARVAARTIENHLKHIAEAIEGRSA